MASKRRIAMRDSTQQQQRGNRRRRGSHSRSTSDVPAASSLQLAALYRQAGLPPASRMLELLIGSCEYVNKTSDLTQNREVEIRKFVSDVARIHREVHESKSQASGDRAEQDTAR